jgi:putative spermidine/putrescine transport system substrate-binding protein
MLYQETRKMFGVAVVAALALFLNSCEKKPAEQQSDKDTALSVQTAGQRELVVVSYGGAYQEAQRKAYFEQFAKKYNVRVREESWTGDMGKIKAMVESGNVTWDVVDVEAYMVLRGADQKLFEKVDYSRVPKDELLAGAVHEYGVANCFWSTILGYNTQRFPAGKQPTSWADFWDVQRFPGARALRKDPVANLELALLAAGVPRDKLYPLDVDKAFESLDKIKTQVKVWWEAGEQPAQLLASGEVALSSAWNGRVYNAAKAGKPAAVEWEGGIISSDWWVIPRGAKNREIAQEFVAFALSAAPQAEYPKYIPYGPVNKKAIQMIAPEILKDLPTAPANFDKQVVIDNQWWHEHQAAVLERWNKWLLQ